VAPDGFDPVAQRPDFPAIEERVLTRWAERDVFARSLRARADAPLFSFFEGPPTANGPPGVHHVEARVFKDVFPRYRTMKGYQVPRKAGWDCHGIPIELEAESELGFTRKQDIEDHGVGAFNTKCRELVTAYVDEWERLTERIGFWVDTENAYWTMSPSYIDSVWWSLATLWERGLLYEGHRVVPYCPRCGTALSDHEVAQGYATTTDPSVYALLPVLDGPLAAEGAALLVWTTTPWTLISNTAVAVGDHLDYVLASPAGDDRPLVVAAALVEEVLGADASVHRGVEIDELVGTHYRAPFEYVTPSFDSPAWHTVTTADFVTTSEGTGVVHLAPAFGADDMAVADELGLPVVNPVDAEGRFGAEVTDFAGAFVKDADPAITEALSAKGLLLAAGEHRHTYPFCWRCDTPLLYIAKPSWYIATTTLRHRLLAENDEVDWHPEHIRHGRYGDWLVNNVDWALSRERYWGTPLPLWRCGDCDAVTALGSVAELAQHSGVSAEGLNPHRPAVDELPVSCAQCGGQAWRVPEVIDAWYDSGAMPFAQFGYPHAPGSVAAFEAAFPADFIAEAIDQTRGWFYSLMAVSTLLFDRNSYQTVLCLGHIVDAGGRKMSKRLGNIADPWELVAAHGADALRWQILTDGSPWVARRVGHEPLAEVTRKFLSTLWNTHYFFATYARLEGWMPHTSAAPELGRRPVMDRWVLAELDQTVRAVDDGLAAFDAPTAGRALTRFVDDLSNWYVRRSRRRFWATDADPADTRAAFATLHECLTTVAELLAPFVPFVADELYEQLVVSVDGDAPDSVHLCDFPSPSAERDDQELRQVMAAARRLVELGRRARNEAGVGVRQPLPTAIVSLAAAEAEPAYARWVEVSALVAEELNVKTVTVPDPQTTVVEHHLKPSYAGLGPAFGSRTPRVAAALEAADAERVAAELASGAAASVEVDGETVTVTTEHVEVVEEPRTGWHVAAEGGFSVALDLTVDEKLRREGHARELIRSLNELRKHHELALDERVRLRVDAGGAAAEAIEAHRGWIASEALALELAHGPVADGEELTVAGEPVRVRIETGQAAV
jgi:isoleucyl-tRNA synthetase